MSSYILVGRTKTDKRWWNDLVRTCAVIGDTFEIHCWSDETAEMKLALRFGQQVRASWHGGAVIRGVITKEFLKFLLESEKPSDTEVYNKMTPFFTLWLGNKLHSEHYGTEIIIPGTAREEQAAISRILNEMEAFATVHRDIG